MNRSDLKAAPAGQLRERILPEVRRSGPIPFSRYMELCLYEPELGYYARPREQFGKAGDFYTSSDVHAVFGRLLARQFDELWRVLGSPEHIDLLELGPGRGLFAGDVLDWSAKQFPEFFRALRYQLLERSQHLRTKLHERLAEHINTGRAQILDSLVPCAARHSQLSLHDVGSAGLQASFQVASPSEGLQPRGAAQADAHEQRSLIVFANEFFDALPVSLIDHRGAVRVAEEKGSLVERFVPPSPAEMEYLDRYSIHPQEGERVEVSLAALEWMDRIAELFRRRPGFVMLIDYGYTREEQLAGRHLDTLMTYRSHRASTSPYEAPGDQDITAHVNFSPLRQRGTDNGLDDVSLLTQTQLLLGIGEETQFADAFQECSLPQERAKVALQLRHLLSPEEMGEKFHVLLMSHGVAREDVQQLSPVKWLAR